MTPIQELIEWMHLHYKSGKETCSPTLIMFKLNEIKAKEREFSKECFEAGQSSIIRRTDSITVRMNEPLCDDFEYFYKSLEK